MKIYDKYLQVVSTLQNLPIRISLVPFRESSSEHSSLWIAAVPEGGFHNIKRVEHSGRSLKQCGHVQQCVFKSGKEYQVWADVSGHEESIGTLKVDIFEENIRLIEYKEEYCKDKDFIKIIVAELDEIEPVFAGALSIY